MNINFDIHQTLICEFGFGTKQGVTSQFALTMLDDAAQTAVERVVASTLESILEQASDPVEFDPSEKYSGREYLILPLHHDLTSVLMELHETDNLVDETPQVATLRSAYCYFYRGTDIHGQRLTALNRAAQFKATLGKQGQIMALMSDSLRIVEDPLVQLNTGFDIVIDDANVHILRPASFRVLANVDDAIAAAVPRNIETIASSVPFVNWANIQDYAEQHPRAASYLASIRTKGFADGLSREALMQLCAGQRIPVDDQDGQISVDERSIMAFLEVIDRRRYEIGLVPGIPEQYKASSRTRVGGSIR